MNLKCFNIFLLIFYIKFTLNITTVFIVRNNLGSRYSTSMFYILE